MYKLSLLLMLCVAFFPGKGNAEFLYGKVIEINQERQEFVVVSVTRDTGEARPIEKNIHVNVAALEGGRPQSTSDKSILPGCVQVGGMVRMWGKLLADEDVFHARIVRGCRGGNCGDPTGVRSRLHGKKRRNCGTQQQGDKSQDITPINNNDRSGHEGKDFGEGGRHGGGGGRGR